MLHLLNNRYLSLRSTDDVSLPPAKPGQAYMLYAHIPFCEQLCPYCSFNRYPFSAERALPYFASLHVEMHMLKALGYDFQSLYIGGGTPTVMVDELCAFIDDARATFSIKEVSCETNPNHLTPRVLDLLEGRVQRLSVGVQSFDDGLLQQMQRFGKYGSGMETLKRILAVAGRFESFNVDMIFNFPSQTEEILINDLAFILESGASQVSFYPLMASPAVSQSLAQTVGRVDYGREERFYHIICDALTGGKHPAFTFGSAWTFNAFKPQGRVSLSTAGGNTAMIDEYIVDYEEYPAIGSGGMSYLDGSLYVNTFSVKEYNRAISEGCMSVMGRTRFAKWDRMRYRFMMQLFGLRLDKRQWKRDFGCSVARGLPAEYNFFKAAGAISYEDDEKILLTPKGRYLMVALMREFFIGVNKVRDQARAALDGEEHKLIFGG
jgi:coproporphyrinogen III oxidase-like Fe-S oxidoreductase